MTALKSSIAAYSMCRCASCLTWPCATSCGSIAAWSADCLMHFAEPGKRQWVCWPSVTCANWRSAAGMHKQGLSYTPLAGLLTGSAAPVIEMWSVDQHLLCLELLLEGATHSAL